MREARVSVPAGGMGSGLSSAIGKHFSKAAKRVSSRHPFCWPEKEIFFQKKKQCRLTLPVCRHQAIVCSLPQLSRNGMIFVY
jgi:hypothetical protein